MSHSASMVVKRSKPILVVLPYHQCLGVHRFWNKSCYGRNLSVEEFRDVFWMYFLLNLAF